MAERRSVNPPSEYIDCLPARDDRGHKGSFGAVAVVGGSASMLGAPCFAAAGALRSGVGSVRLTVPDAMAVAAMALVPSAIAEPLSEGPRGWLRALPPDAVIIVGCGWGRNVDRLPLLQALLASSHRLLIDGDGLELLAELPSELLPRRAPLILTPHAGEYAQLAQAWTLPSACGDEESRISAAAALAIRAQAAVVLKGAHSVVSDGHSTSVELSQNAALAIPGSGDVLSGVIAGLAAQGMEALPAVRLGVRLHAAAGGLWRRRMGPGGMMAMQLADLLPEAMREYGLASSQHGDGRG